MHKKKEDKVAKPPTRHFIYYNTLQVNQNPKKPKAKKKNEVIKITKHLHAHKHHTQRPKFDQDPNHRQT